MLYPSSMPAFSFFPSHGKASSCCWEKKRNEDAFSLMMRKMTTTTMMMIRSLMCARHENSTQKKPSSLFDPRTYKQTHRHGHTHTSLFPNAMRILSRRVEKWRKNSNNKREGKKRQKSFLSEKSFSLIFFSSSSAHHITSHHYKNRILSTNRWRPKKPRASSRCRDSGDRPIYVLVTFQILKSIEKEGLCIECHFVCFILYDFCESKNTLHV